MKVLPASTLALVRHMALARVQGMALARVPGMALARALGMARAQVLGKAQARVLRNHMGAQTLGMALAQVQGMEPLQAQPALRGKGPEIHDMPLFPQPQHRRNQHQPALRRLQQQVFRLLPECFHRQIAGHQRVLLPR